MFVVAEGEGHLAEVGEAAVTVHHVGPLPLSWKRGAEGAADAVDGLDAGEGVVGDVDEWAELPVEEVPGVLVEVVPGLRVDLPADAQQGR